MFHKISSTSLNKQQCYQCRREQEQSGLLCDQQCRMGQIASHPHPRFKQKKKIAKEYRLHNKNLRSNDHYSNKLPKDRYQQHYGVVYPTQVIQGIIQDIKIIKTNLTQNPKQKSVVSTINNESKKKPKQNQNAQFHQNNNHKTKQLEQYSQELKFRIQNCEDEISKCRLDNQRLKIELEKQLKLGMIDIKKNNRNGNEKNQQKDRRYDQRKNNNEIRRRDNNQQLKEKYSISNGRRPIRSVGKFTKLKYAVKEEGICEKKVSVREEYGLDNRKQRPTAFTGNSKEFESMNSVHNYVMQKNSDEAVSNTYYSSRILDLSDSYEENPMSLEQLTKYFGELILDLQKASPMQQKLIRSQLLKIAERIKMLQQHQQQQMQTQTIQTSTNQDFRI